MATGPIAVLGVGGQVDRAEAAHGQQLFDAVAAVQHGAGGGRQRRAAALAVAFAGRVGDAAGRVGAEVGRPFGLGGGRRRPGAGSRSPCRRWRRAAAALPQAGQLAGVEDGAAPAAGLAPGAGTGGVGTLPSGTAPAGGGRGAGRPPPATAAGCGAGRAPTVNGFLHAGTAELLAGRVVGDLHLPCLQCGQLITCGMVVPRCLVASRERQRSEFGNDNSVADARLAYIMSSAARRSAGRCCRRGSVAVAQRRRLGDRLVVEVGAAGRLGVGQQVAVVLAQDAGVQLLDGVVAEQADVARLGPADGRLVLGQHQLAAGPEAGLDLEPRLLEDHLGQADQQADAQAEDDQADGQAAVGQRLARRLVGQTSRPKKTPPTKPPSKPP